MKTTVEISDPLLEAARKIARRDGTTVRALLEQGLRLAIEERRRSRHFRLRDAAVDGHGLQAGAGALSWEELRAITYGSREGST